MNNNTLPLLLFPNPTPVRREAGQSSPPSIHVPNHARQRERLGPRFNNIQVAFDERRLEIQGDVPNDDPDLVVVFETVGAVSDFIRAAERIPGMEWLFGTSEAQFDADEDFYDRQNVEKPIKGKLFLVGSNRRALDEVIGLWTRYTEDPSVNLGHGLNAWKQVFSHLRDVRFWGPADRLDSHLRQSWLNWLQSEPSIVRFEIEAWCFSSANKNSATSDEIRLLIGNLGGHVINSLLLPEIAYHGFLVELPPSGLQQILDNENAPILISDRVMFLRPHGQIIARSDESAQLADTAIQPHAASGLPVVALLDGLPLANHPRLRDHILIDDPDDWASSYTVKSRVHGTAMASLIIWGGLDSSHPPLPNPIYVRPILRAAGASATDERTPDDILLIDLVHAAVRRMFERAPNRPAAAPTVRVINLSIGDSSRPFSGDLSPWARLLDWLAYKYKVLFIVSTGNCADDLILNLPRETLATLTPEARTEAAMQALLSEDTHRRLISPAESINALTVGACHSDDSAHQPAPNRHILFQDLGIAPYSNIGPGFRRSVKPDILVPGGRVLYSERPLSPPTETHVSGVWGSPRAPGFRVAAPPDATGDSVYTRGTSNAAALATRAAAQALAVVNELRSRDGITIESRYDAVLAKALLAHGASVANVHSLIVGARPDIEHWHAQRRLVSRYAGYGVADVGRALTCTEQRATMLGVGDLRNEQALEFHVPIPTALNARLVRRRLTCTLAWLTPTNARHSKHRIARLWVDLPDDPLRLSRVEGEAKQAQLGTLQHEIWEGENAVPIVDEQELLVRVNCVKDAGAIEQPIEFALCVTLEVADGIDVPIYEQIRARIEQRIHVTPSSQ